MEVSKEYLAERYASMSKTELLSINPNKLTDVAKEVYQDEIAKRNYGQSDVQQVEQQRQKTKQAEKQLVNKNYSYLLKTIIAVGALCAGKTMAHGYVVGGAMVFALLLAIAFVFRKFL